MERIHGFIDEGDQTITIWMPGDTPKNLRLVKRIKQAFVAELNKRFGEEDWENCRDVLETGAEIAKFIEMKEAEAKKEEGQNDETL